MHFLTLRLFCFGNWFGVWLVRITCIFVSLRVLCVGKLGLLWLGGLHAFPFSLYWCCVLANSCIRLHSRYWLVFVLVSMKVIGLGPRFLVLIWSTSAVALKTRPNPLTPTTTYYTLLLRQNKQTS